MQRSVAIVVGLSVAAATGCSSSHSSAPASPTTAPCSDVAISRFQELEIVDPAVVNDPRALNAQDGIWSFRHVVEALTPKSSDPASFVNAWLTSWMTTQTVNHYTLEPRTGVQAKVICPWLQRTPTNACDAMCNTCAERVLDMSVAPFRLMAIANRIDQRDSVDDEPAGEGRLAYALVDGSGDDPNAKPLEMTVIFEFTHPTDDGSTAKTWAERWHALGAFHGFGDDYKNALATVTESFVHPRADGTSPIAQVRTNERVFDWQWELREYALDGSTGMLVPTTTKNAPDESLNGQAELVSAVRANQASVLKGRPNLPPWMLGGRVHTDDGPWVLPGVDEATRKAFAKQTCNGCHRSEEQSIDINFQVSPLRQGYDRLSPSLNNPNDPAHDLLGERTVSMQNALCGGAPL